jgi:hypothetical protein
MIMCCEPDYWRDAGSGGGFEGDGVAEAREGSPATPGRNRDPWAFPRAPHPTEQDPATHVRVGTGPDTGPDYVFDLYRSSSDVLTQHVRPHVAMLVATVHHPLDGVQRQTDSRPRVPRKRRRWRAAHHHCPPDPKDPAGQRAKTTHTRTPAAQNPVFTPSRRPAGPWRLARKSLSATTTARRSPHPQGNGKVVSQ